jgi:hypothetical protein
MRTEKVLAFAVTGFFVVGAASIGTIVFSSSPGEDHQNLLPMQGHQPVSPPRAVSTQIAHRLLTTTSDVVGKAWVGNRQMTPVLLTQGALPNSR